MSFDRRAFLATAAAAASASCGPLSAASKPALRPEDFGARGDGVTNDTRAFAALGAEVNRRGGGTIALGTGRTYLVGDDRPGHGRVAGIKLTPFFALEGLSAPLTIIGNSALGFAASQGTALRYLRRRDKGSRRQADAQPQQGAGGRVALSGDNSGHQKLPLHRHRPRHRA